MPANTVFVKHENINTYKENSSPRRPPQYAIQADPTATTAILAPTPPPVIASRRLADAAISTLRLPYAAVLHRLFSTLDAGDKGPLRRPGSAVMTAQVAAGVVKIASAVLWQWFWGHTAARALAWTRSRILAQTDARRMFQPAILR